MEFIVDYINKESKIDSITEPIIESDIEPINETIEDNHEELKPNLTQRKTKSKSSKASKKQLENLERAREKAKETIKRNKQLKNEYLKQKEQEEAGDLGYLSEKLKYYQDKVDEKMKDLNKYSKKPHQDKYEKREITQLDILLDKLF